MQGPSALPRCEHPSVNRTCHGSACPRTKDNCDLDKHWGKHKGKGQVLSYSLSARGLLIGNHLYELTGATNAVRLLRLKRVAISLICAVVETIFGCVIPTNLS